MSNYLVMQRKKNSSNLKTLSDIPETKFNLQCKYDRIKPLRSKCCGKMANATFRDINNNWTTYNEVLILNGNWIHQTVETVFKRRPCATWKLSRFSNPILFYFVKQYLKKVFVYTLFRFAERITACASSRYINIKSTAKLVARFHWIKISVRTFKFW